MFLQRERIGTFDSNITNGTPQVVSPTSAYSAFTPFMQCIFSLSFSIATHWQSSMVKPKSIGKRTLQNSLPENSSVTYIHPVPVKFYSSAYSTNSIPNLIVRAASELNSNTFHHLVSGFKQNQMGLDWRAGRETFTQLSQADSMHSTEHKTEAQVFAALCKLD